MFIIINGQYGCSISIQYIRTGMLSQFFYTTVANKCKQICFSQLQTKSQTCCWLYGEIQKKLLDRVLKCTHDVGIFDNHREQFLSTQRQHAWLQFCFEIKSILFWSVVVGPLKGVGPMGYCLLFLFGNPTLNNVGLYVNVHGRFTYAPAVCMCVFIHYLHWKSVKKLYD